MAELSCIGFDDTLSVRNGLAVLPYRVLYITGQEPQIQVLGLAVGQIRFELHKREPKTIGLDQPNDGLIADVRQVLAEALDEFENREVIEVLILHDVIQEAPRIRARIQRLIQTAQAALE